MKEIRYPYRPKIFITILGVLFFGFCACFMAQVAINNEGGLVINHVIHFSTQGATVFYWIIAALSAVFVIGAIWALLIGLGKHREIIIYEKYMSCPKSGISKKIVKINFDEVIDIDIQEVQRTVMLVIKYKGGSLTIANSMLPNKKAFDELVDTIVARCNWEKPNKF